MLKVKLYGLEGDRTRDRICTSRLVIVALSAQPPGVNKLFVCLFVCVLALLAAHLTDNLDNLFHFVFSEERPEEMMK